MRNALFAAAAALALGACAAAAQKPSMIDDALDAYVKGDMGAFETFVVKADTAADAAKSVPDYDTACTQAAIDARRAVALAKELHGLDASPVFSMSDEARYIFMSADYHDASMYLENSGARPGCEKSDPAPFYADALERRGWLGRYGTRVHKWQVDLRQRSPADYEQRLDQATIQLERNHMGRFVEVRS